MATPCTGQQLVYFAPRVLTSNVELPGKFLVWLYSASTDRAIHFWGDLDFAGMDILKELRVVFPEAQAWGPATTPPRPPVLG